MYVIDFLVLDIFGHEVKGYLNILGVVYEMLHRTMEENGVEGATPKFWLRWSVWIVWKLDVDNVILVLGMSGGCLIVCIMKPREYLLVGRHTNPDCILLFCLIRQFKPFIVGFDVDQDNIHVSVHPIVVRSGSSRENHRGVSGRIVRS